MLFLVVNELQVRIHLDSVSRLSPTPHPSAFLLAQVKIKMIWLTRFFPLTAPLWLSDFMSGYTVENMSFAPADNVDLERLLASRGERQDGSKRDTNVPPL